jgi:hypothetical protein
MAAVFALLAGAVVPLHVVFVAFVVGGAFLALRWGWIPWLHLPAAAFVESSVGVAPAAWGHPRRQGPPHLRMEYHRQSQAPHRDVHSRG